MPRLEDLSLEDLTFGSCDLVDRRVTMNASDPLITRNLTKPFNSRGEAEMLRAVPKHWLSSKYKVLENDTTIAMVDSASFREAATLTIKGSIYRAYREGWMSGAFILESDGSILAQAVKPSSLYRSFQVEHEGMQYTLEAASAWSSKFVLSAGGVQLGSVYSEHAMTRKAIIDFPEEISLPGRIFMFWLVMILWKRASDSASS